MGKSDARDFADRLSVLLGPHQSIRVVNSTRPGLPPVCCFFFRDRPQPGIMTAVTYGLSLAEHPEWRREKPELVLCVNSLDEAWGISMASLAERLRGTDPFSVATVLHSDEPLADGSEMSALLIYPQRAVPLKEAVLDLPSLRIELRGVFPIHQCEMPVIQKIGAEAFLNRQGLDPFDVERIHFWE